MGATFGDGTVPGGLGTGMYDPKGTNQYAVDKSAFTNQQGLDDDKQIAANKMTYYANRNGPQATASGIDHTYQTKAANDMATTGNANLGNATTGNATMGTANLGTANTGTATMADNTTLGTVQNADAANISRQDSQFRNQQQGLSSQLEQAAAGRGPSLAASQLGAANAAATAQRMASAASDRGFGNTAATNRQLAYAQGAAQQSNAMASAQTKIQEQQAAQASLGNVLNSARSEDIGVNTSQAGLNQQTNLANQDANNQFTLNQAQMDQQTALQNAAAGNQFGLANMSALNTQGLANQSALNNQGLTNQAASNTQDLANMQALNSQSQINQGALNTQGLANQSALNAAASQNATANTAANTFNAGAQNTTLQTNAALQQQTKLANQATQLQTMGLNDAQIRSLLGITTGIDQQKMADNQAYEELMENQNVTQNAINQKSYADAAQHSEDTSDKALNFMAMSDENEKTNVSDMSTSNLNNFFDSISNTTDAAKNDGSSVLSSVLNSSSPSKKSGGSSSSMSGMMSVMGDMSDERQKKNISNTSEPQVKEFLNTMGGHKYDYKDTSQLGTDSKTHFSPMAQELEKSEIGKSMVYTDPKSGTKYVDYSRGVGALMAATAEINKRLNALEKKK